MSLDKIGQPGFGIGAFYGVPITVGVATSTSVTITGTAYSTTQYLIALSGTTPSTVDNNLIRFEAVTTNGGVTGTYMLCNSYGANFYNDQQSFRAVNLSSVSVSIVLLS